MRWKFSGDGNSAYTCMGCLNVKAGTFLLGVISLLLQVATLSLLTMAFLHPSFVPTWISSFVAPRFNDHGIHAHGNMMGSNNVMVRNAMMGDSGMMGGKMMSSTEREAMMDDNGMMGDKMMSSSDKKKMMGDSGMMDGKMMSSSERNAMLGDSGMMDGKMMSSSDKKKMMGDSGMVDGKMMSSSERNAMMGDSGMMDGKMMSSGHSGSLSSLDDPSIFETSTRKFMKLDADDKFLLFILLVGCIASSVMLLNGIIKVRPGYLMPFMGLQVFDFCLSSIAILSCFSNSPDIKRWIAAQHDSLPFKSRLLAVDADRLMLAFVTLAITILIIQAYLMSVVWSCYKFLLQTQQSAARGRRRSNEEDIICNLEDAELLLPPKYEDIIDLPEEQRVTEPGPPPYQAE